MEYSFSDVTLLVTHYNRSNSLEHLLNSFRKLGVRFGGIVVSDDGSKPEHISRLRLLAKEFSFDLITTEKNKGLGNNINKGQDAVKTPFTLYVQEDFEPTDQFPDRFVDAIQFMNQDADLDMVRFYAYIPYPYVRPKGKGFSEMIFPNWATNYKKIYYYSDHPHLRRSNFLEKFGRYPEGMKGDKTEYEMCISFLKKKGKGLFYNDFQSLFIQRNSEAEPSTMTRSPISQSSNPVISLVRDIYRQLKYNYDIYLR